MIKLSKKETQYIKDSVYYETPLGIWTVFYLGDELVLSGARTREEAQAIAVDLITQIINGETK